MSRCCFVEFQLSTDVYSSGHVSQSLLWPLNTLNIDGAQTSTQKIPNIGFWIDLNYISFHGNVHTKVLTLYRPFGPGPNPLTTH